MGSYVSEFTGRLRWYSSGGGDSWASTMSGASCSRIAAQLPLLFELFCMLYVTIFIGYLWLLESVLPSPAVTSP